MLKIVLTIAIAFVPFQTAVSSEFRTECLRLHNRIRAIHNVPRLKHSQKLEDNAAKWAQEISKTEQYTRQPNNTYGENLFLVNTNTLFPAFDAIRGWYKEIRNYNFDKPMYGNDVMHFTQMVNTNTSYLGCVLLRKDNFDIVVANYGPAFDPTAPLHTSIARPVINRNVF